MSASRWTAWRNSPSICTTSSSMWRRAKNSSSVQRRGLVRNQPRDAREELACGDGFGLLFSAGADIHSVSLGFLVADHEQKWNFLQRVLADLGIHLFVAAVHVDTN